MSADGGTLTTTGYIQHHLTNLTVCSDAARDVGRVTVMDSGPSTSIPW